MRSNAPGTQLFCKQVHFQILTEAFRRMIKPAESGEPGGIAAEEPQLLLLPVEIAETGDIGSGRSPAVRRAVLETIVFGGDMSAVIVEGHIPAQQAVVITQAVRE